MKKLIIKDFDGDETSRISCVKYINSFLENNLEYENEIKKAEKLILAGIKSEILPSMDDLKKEDIAKELAKLGAVVELR